MHDLARLLGQPGREWAALDLVGATGPSATVIQASTGPQLDEAARLAYKRRLLELEAELDEADARGNRERSARAMREREFLVAELGAAYGLGGRARPVGESAERARTTVGWRIRDAISHIERVDPALGLHLRNSVRTGRFCVYQPESPHEWEL